MNIDRNTTVGELAASVNGAVRLFERLQIDYCCGGKRPLEEVCREKNLGVDEVVAALQTINDVQPAGGDRDWTAASLSELAQHIVTRHHAFVRREIPRITALLTKICEVHGERRPEFLKVREHWDELTAELDHHLTKEERILFPYIEQLENASRGSGEQVPAPFGSVRYPIQMMMNEHDSAGHLLATMQGLLTDRSGCNTCLEFFRSLDGFEKDLHQHIHLENNILFPRAERLETAVGPGQFA
ncbi:MAG TPA: iron-sulfur cluster repair di-iron protein [Acidobacteriota bacterium]|nr:iron-sulfur cluster repair di-iron protein [Acidobacteriota bacterium]